MSKSSYIIIILVILILIAGILVVRNSSNGSLIGPNFVKGLSKQVSPVPSPSVSPKPKTFDFNATTDLQAELDTVNPEVLDSDFDE